MNTKNKIKKWIIINILRWNCWKEIDCDENGDVYGYNWWYERNNSGAKLLCFEFATEE